MAQTHGVDTPLYDQDSANQQQNMHADDTLSQYNILSPEELIRLAEENTPEAREKLLEIAEQFDIVLDDSVTPREIVDKIILAMDNQDAPNMYHGTE